MLFFSAFRMIYPAAASLLLLSFSIAFGGSGGAYSYHLPPKGENYFHSQVKTVIGSTARYTVNEKDTFLDIAREFGLGYNEMEDMFPDIDPWIPPKGTELSLPSMWVLPETRLEGIVINIAEMRLFFFMKEIGMVKTYPVGIGDEGWHTPIGNFYISDKRKNPTWYIPASLQEKYGAKTMPPGPDNPLGDFWIGMGRPGKGNSGYGIHGTDIPWSVGRLVTHGCIRLYPEHVEHLFPLVEPRTPVEIIYEPVKLGVRNGRIFAEVHRDIYRRIENLTEYGFRRLAEKGLEGRVDLKKFEEALKTKNGFPVDITRAG